jgi:hypothetical protein
MDFSHLALRKCVGMQKKNSWLDIKVRTSSVMFHLLLFNMISTIPYALLWASERELRGSVCLPDFGVSLKVFHKKVYQIVPRNTEMLNVNRSYVYVAFLFKITHIITSLFGMPCVE